MASSESIRTVSLNSAESPGEFSGEPLKDSSFPPPDATPIRILLADESSMFRDGLRALLSAQSDLTIVAEAATPESVSELAVAHRADVILFDFGSVSASIPTLLRLRASGVPARVILLTAPEDLEMLSQAIRYGVVGIVPRNSPTELLLKSIRKVNAGELWLNRAATAEIIRQLASEPSPLPRGLSGELTNSLSRREREIVALVAQGYRNREISQALSINEQTVKNHLHNIFEKTGVRDRLELALYAIYHRMHA